MKDMKFINT